MWWVVGFVISIPMLMLVQSEVLVWVDSRLEASIEVSSARKLVVLAGQVEKYVHANYGDLTDTSNPASREISLTTLESQDLLPDGFGEGDAMKRGHKVWVQQDADGDGDGHADGLSVVSMQVVQDFDDWWPGSGVFEARGRQALGVVDENGMLRGPSIAGEDLTAFQAAAGGDPKENALAVYQMFDASSVCGDWLFRRERGGCPDAARMETDLDLNGNDIEGVGRLEAENLELSAEAVIGGDFVIDGELAVGSAVRIEGAFVAPGNVTFTGDAEFSGEVVANEVDVTNRIEAESANVRQDVTATNVTADGNVNANAVSASTLNSSTGFIGLLTVGNCSGC